MQALPKIESGLLEPRATVADKDGGGLGPWLRLTDYPDLSCNPKLWVKLFLEGFTLHRRSFALASRSNKVLDLGCGGGWFSIKAARSNTKSRVVALDKDHSQIRWGDSYYQRLQREGAKLGTVDFLSMDIADYPWQENQQEFDLVHAGFILSRVKSPAVILEGIYQVLRPGGWLIYHDAIEPPAKNLDLLARLQHGITRWQDPASDPWAWRRVWLQRYLFDTARAFSRSEEPAESQIFGRIEELFAMRFQEKRRSFLDLYLSRSSRNTIPHVAMIPAVKFADDLLTKMGIVDGACRYVLAQKR